MATASSVTMCRRSRSNTCLATIATQGLPCGLASHSLRCQAQRPVLPNMPCQVDHHR